MKASETDLKNLRAADIMNEDLIYAATEMTVLELVKLFRNYEVRGVPVIDSEGKAVGVVSETDVVKVEADKEASDAQVPPYFRTAWEDWDSGPESVDYDKLDIRAERTVEEIMTPGVISVREDASVAQVAQRMLEDKIHRVFVTDPRGQLKGIIGTLDLIQLLAQAGKA